MRKKALALALAGVGTAAVLGSSTGCNQQQAGAAAQALGMYMLVQLTATGADDPFDFTLTEHFIVDPDGNVVKFGPGENAAWGRRVGLAASCGNGNAILTTGNSTFYFYDAQKRTISFLGWTRELVLGGFTPIRNSKGLVVGVYNTNQNNFLIAFCDGKWVGGTEESNNVRVYVDRNTLVIEYSNNNPVRLATVPIPQGLTGQITKDPNNLLSSVNVEADRNYFDENSTALSNKYRIYAEYEPNNGNPRIVAFVFINRETGEIFKKKLQNPVDPTAVPGDGSIHNTAIAVDASDGNTYFAFGTVGRNNANLIYGKIDANKNMTTNTINSGNADQFRDGAMDREGNLYYRKNSNNTVYSVKAGQSQEQSKNLTSGTFSGNNRFNGSEFLALTNGVVIARNNNAFDVYTAGNNTISAVSANTASETAARICTQSFNTLNDGRVVCFDPGQGKNELSFLPSANQSDWKTVNPDDKDTNDRLVGGANNWGVINTDVFVRGSTNFANAKWYKCPYGGTKCTPLQNVTPYDLPNFNRFPTTGTPLGYPSVIDLANDKLQSFTWPNPNFTYSNDASLLGSSVAYPGLGCGIIGEKLGEGSYNEVLISLDQILNLPNQPMVFNCNVLHVYQSS